MAQLHIHFGMWLHSFQEYNLMQPHGPYFTRWLPDGEKDAIRIPSAEPGTSISVWTVRRGYTGDQGLIEYDSDRSEVDPAIMERQGFLDAGALYGVFTVRVTDADIRAVTKGEPGNEDYVRLGKRLVNLMYEPLDRLVKVLKVNYGQYWLDDVVKWDRRSGSIGHHCSTWQMSWSVDGANWTPFRPTTQEVFLTSTVYGDLKRYGEFLTRDDWSAIERVCAGDYKPSVAAYLLSRCHRLLASGEVRYALIEGAAALEIVVVEYVRKKSKGKVEQQVLNFMDHSPADGRMATVAYLTEGVDPADVELAAEAINQRNKVIHEGADVDERTLTLMKAVMRIVARLDGGPVFKFPKMGIGNCVASSEDFARGHPPP